MKADETTRPHSPGPNELIPERLAIMSRAPLAYALVLALAAGAAHAAEKTLPSPKEAKTFAARARKCLTKSDAACLAGLVAEGMYFPEQRDFGCETADAKRRAITPAEFAACALTSKTKDRSAGSTHTLREALAECVGGRASYERGMGYLKGKTYACHLERRGGKVVLTGVMAGC